MFEGKLVEKFERQGWSANSLSNDKEVVLVGTSFAMTTSFQFPVLINILNFIPVILVKTSIRVFNI